MMEDFVRRFIRSSVLWLGVGVALGLAMAFWPGRALVYRPAHMHANLLGFVSMMIFGVAYHVLPRFTGQPLHRRSFAAAHLWLANAGLTLLVGGWITRGAAAAPALAAALLGAGAVLSAAGACLFIYNVWRMMDAAARASRPTLSFAGASARPGMQERGAEG